MAVEGLPHLTGGGTVGNISCYVVYACCIACHFLWQSSFLTPTMQING